MTNINCLLNGVVHWSMGTHLSAWNGVATGTNYAKCAPSRTGPTCRNDRLPPSTHANGGKEAMLWCYTERSFLIPQVFFPAEGHAALTPSNRIPDAIGKRCGLRSASRACAWRWPSLLLAVFRLEL